MLPSRFGRFPGNRIPAGGKTAVQRRMRRNAVCFAGSRKPRFEIRISKEYLKVGSPKERRGGINPGHFFMPATVAVLPFGISGFFRASAIQVSESRLNPDRPFGAARAGVGGDARFPGRRPRSEE